MDNSVQWWKTNYASLDLGRRKARTFIDSRVTISLVDSLLQSNMFYGESAQDYTVFTCANGELCDHIEKMSCR